MEPVQTENDPFKIKEPQFTMNSIGTNSTKNSNAFKVQPTHSVSSIASEKNMVDPFAIKPLVSAKLKGKPFPKAQDPLACSGKDQERKDRAAKFNALVFIIKIDEKIFDSGPIQANQENIRLV